MPCALLANRDTLRTSILKESLCKQRGAQAKLQLWTTLFCLLVTHRGKKTFKNSQFYSLNLTRHPVGMGNAPENQWQSQQTQTNMSYSANRFSTFVCVTLNEPGVNAFFFFYNLCFFRLYFSSHFSSKLSLNTNTKLLYFPLYCACFKNRVWGTKRAVRGGTMTEIQVQADCKTMAVDLFFSQP